MAAVIRTRLSAFSSSAESVAAVGGTVVGAAEDRLPGPASPVAAGSPAINRAIGGRLPPNAHRISAIGRAIFNAVTCPFTVGAVVVPAHGLAIHRARRRVFLGRALQIAANRAAVHGTSVGILGPRAGAIAAAVGAIDPTQRVVFGEPADSIPAGLAVVGARGCSLGRFATAVSATEGAILRTALIGLWRNTAKVPAPSLYIDAAKTGLTTASREASCASTAFTDRGASAATVAVRRTASAGCEPQPTHPDDAGKSTTVWRTAAIQIWGQSILPAQLVPSRQGQRRIPLMETVAISGAILEAVCTTKAADIPGKLANVESAGEY